MPCFDVARLLRIVTEGLAQLLDAGHERVIAHDRVAPHRGKQLLLGYGLTGAADEQAQDSGRFRCEPDFGRIRPQARRLRLETVWAETDELIHRNCMRDHRYGPAPTCPDHSPGEIPALARDSRDAAPLVFCHNAVARAS